MQEIINLIIQNGLGVGSFLALIFIGKYVLENINKSITDNTKVLSSVVQTLTLVNNNLINLTNRVEYLEKGDE